MKRGTITCAASIMLAILLTGCGAAVEKDATYDSPEALAKAINSVTDWDCEEDPGKYTDTRGKLGWMRIDCGPHTTATMFNSEHIRDDVVDKSVSASGERALLGRDWAAFGEQFEIEELQQ